MKGTYDNPNIEFSIKARYTERGESKYSNTFIPYEQCDGLTIDTTRKIFLDELYNEASHPEDIILADLYLFANVKKINSSKTYEEVEVCLADLIYPGEESLDYAFARKLISTIDRMNAQEKKYTFAFLERYVIDYNKVKKFVKTGKIYYDFYKINDEYGVSSQGTSLKR